MLQMLKPCLALLTCTMLLSGASAGEGPLSAEEFDAYTRGKTLFYGQNGQAYGAEEYLENRRVRWSFLDGECKEGEWYEQGEQICFVYDDNPDPQCWTFRLDANGLSARFQDLAGATELYEAEDIGEEMICLGPEIGV